MESQQNLDILEHVPGLNCTIRVSPHSHYVEYEVFMWDGVNADGTPVFHKKGSADYPDPVYTLAESEVYLHGSVKWDGCSNWEFDEQTRGNMLYGGNKQELINIGLILAHCWTLTAKHCPAFSA